MIFFNIIILFLINRALYTITKKSQNIKIFLKNCQVNMYF